jgi:hypothetical protein
MKTMSSVGLVNWMLKHLTFGAYDESLTGDLLEELRSGRSPAWYWSQTVFAIAVSLTNKSRAYVFPLAFSAGWSMLYPALGPSIMGSQAAHTIAQRMAAYDLPYSTALRGIGELTPVALFVWIGFFVYLSSLTQMVSKPGPLRLLGSLSISLNVLLVAIIGQHLKGSGIDVRNVSRDDFNSHFVAFSIPIVLSLFSALVCASPQTLQGKRRSAALR